jgi:hypothetical protein
VGTVSPEVARRAALECELIQAGAVIVDSIWYLDGVLYLILKSGHPVIVDAKAYQTSGLGLAPPADEGGG